TTFHGSFYPYKVRFLFWTTKRSRVRFYVVQFEFIDKMPEIGYFCFLHAGIRSCVAFVPQISLEGPIMIRSLVLCVLVMLAACRGTDDIRVPQPAPAPPAEPEVDLTFMDAQAVKAWRAQIATQIELDAAVPHPREIWRYVADFKVDRSRPDPILGDPSVWDAAKVADPVADPVTSDAPTSSPDEALMLETGDRELDAAQIWIALNRFDDAKRCSVELEKEGEWMAVALIAVHTGDLTTLDRATKRMVGADQISRTKTVASYAVGHGKVDIAKHIATMHGWRISEILNSYQVRELAIKGDTSLLIEMLSRELTVWEKNEFVDSGDPQVVADIVILARTDKVKAREYASRYLRLSHANVLIWTRCFEGCYSEPVRGALELYQLIRADQSLRELYFARLRAAIDEMFPVKSGDETQTVATSTIWGINSGSYSGWGTDMWGNGPGGALLSSYLLHVRAIGDHELTIFWVDMLDTFPNRSGMDRTLVFELELGRCALGLPFYQVVGNITPTEKFILEELKGGANNQMEDTWAAWDKELQPPVYREEVEYLFKVLTRGEVSPSREATIRTELNQQTPGRSLADELQARFYRSLEAHYGYNWPLEDFAQRANYAMRINAIAKQLRVQRGLPELDLYPDTKEELVELMAPSMEPLCQKLPVQCLRLTRRITPAVASAPPPTEGMVWALTP
ncbi:MAG: hypothetical protein NUV84_02780, partial [Candidatus Uhrbacteria bacterium]|nr:hypothetical protein [Candidatus Uhrbacteria bacterium]